MKLRHFCVLNLNAQIIYFQVKDFHIPFITRQRISFKFFAKIMRGVVFFVFQVVLVLILQATLIKR